MISTENKKNLFEINNYIVYYGPDNIDTINKFDLAIIEPQSYKIEDMKELHKNGTVLIAYLSIIELNADNTDNENMNFNKFLLRVNGEVLKNEIYGTFFMDLCAAEWLEYLFHKIKTFIKEYGYDGIFLDTVGNLEDFNLPDYVKFKQMSALVDFLYTLRKEHPNVIILQNNGYKTLINYTKKYVDGMILENPDSFNHINKKLNRMFIKKLNEMQMKDNIRIFILTEASCRFNKVLNFVKKHAFLCYNAPVSYNEV